MAKPHQVRVNTIGFLYEVGAPTLKQIAGENNGTYKFVSEKDLAGIVGGDKVVAPSFGSQGERTPSDF
ncbi:MAG: hypothetical protein WBD63_03005 [Phycisphaerae bacterium]|nr:hypothetical protein [Phycisphaerae bacterium]